MTELVHDLSHDGVTVDVTTMCTLAQVETATAAVAGGSRPSYLSIFAGRIADAGVDPVPLVRHAVEVVGRGTGHRVPLGLAARGPQPRPGEQRRLPHHHDDSATCSASSTGSARTFRSSRLRPSRCSSGTRPPPATRSSRVRHRRPARTSRAGRARDDGILRPDQARLCHRRRRLHRSNLADRLMAGTWPSSATTFPPAGPSFWRQTRRNPRFNFVRGDNLEPAGLPRPCRLRRVFHLAGQCRRPLRRSSTPQKDLEQNTIATFHVLEAMRANGVGGSRSPPPARSTASRRSSPRRRTPPSRPDLPLRRLQAGRRGR